MASPAAPSRLEAAPRPSKPRPDASHHPKARASRIIRDRQHVYRWGIDRPVQLKSDPGTGSEETYYYHDDARGNVGALTDADGNVEYYVEYDAYGDEVNGGLLVDPADTSTLLAREPLGNPYFWQSPRLDPETGHYYYRNRYYNPEQGRFLQADPIGAWGDPGNYGNRYTFGGNVVGAQDPHGRAWGLLVKAGRTVWRVGKAAKNKGLKGLEIKDVFAAQVEAIQVLGDPTATGWQKLGAVVNAGSDLLVGMKDAGGVPETGPTARTLGARPDADIPVDADGMVHPGTGGVSVAPSPQSLPAHRRPPEFGGTGKDPIWGMSTDDLGPDLKHVPDSATHGTIQPARSMRLEEYQDALCDTADCWRKQ